MERANFEGEGAAHCKVKGQSAMSCAKTAEPIEMLFGLVIRVGARNHTLDEGSHSHGKGQFLGVKGVARYKVWRDSLP